MEKTVLVVLVGLVLLVGVIGVTALATGNNSSLKQVSSVSIDDSQELPDSQESAQLNSLAKITKEQANQIALNNVQGTIKDSELENEDGSVVYNVDVVKDNVETEVKIDAGNGNVLSITKEDKDDGNDGEQDSNDESD